MLKHVYIQAYDNIMTVERQYDNAIVAAVQCLYMYVC